MSKNIIEKSTLISYLNGNLDQKEMAEVEFWYEESDGNKAELESLYRLLFIGKSAITKEIDPEISLSELKKQIRKNRPARVFGIPGRTFIRRSLSVAAVVGLLVVSGIVLKTAEQISSRPFAVSTKLGERAQVTLPDGSQVWLNSCSKVEYRTSLFSRTRTVDMTGEAYFEVAHDNSTFTVNSNGLSTRVLGTKFNIRANNGDDNMVYVTLLEGSVHATCDRSQKSFVLQPSQQLCYDAQIGNMKLLECGVQAEQYIGWIDGRLHFDQTMLSDIAHELERYYNVKISIMDSDLGKERFSCDFQTADNIHHILSTLELTNKFSYWVKDNDIVIFKK